MTEQEWLACTHPTPMLEFLRGKVRDRKLRLFALACCCRIVKHLTDQRSVHVVLAVDRHLEGTASHEELIEARAAARLAYENALQPHEDAAHAAACLAADDAYQAAASVSVATDAASAIGYERAAGWSQAEIQELAALLRHIIGNPFRPYAAPACWPATAIQLGQALHNGQDCTFALHDALLEAGHPDLAEHFKDGKHPKGCWAVDLILSRDR
jgi:hypothetical protein